ncbi:hypothetical protein LF887_02985 [Chryseobacterium sp. MEBOG06]|uniref:hypothetical protein n=1 Tax=Chryseobacterium sp. MEBOG06 TaxID=2879938 RepID=UPI001F373DB3|nr:hypothetical protein [Chryseobacterium sp. MEBOG06]UKB84621.1 hypothetical protein LF887_02985 [Chryseobacterium sp. MEBOG06]
MKKISMFVLAICSTAAFAQKVSDYKYIFIPEKFQTFKKSSFGLEESLAKALKGKKYDVLAESVDKWPSDAKNNSCNVLNAEVLNDKNLFTNKVILQFKDCNKKVVFESKGSSDIKEFEEGFADALNQALTKVGFSNPVAMLPAQNTAVNENAQTTVSEVSTSSATPSANHYSNGKMELQKIQIDANQFILANSGSSVPFAVFKTTSKKDVFTVKLAEGNSTIGYFENGNIVIDIPQADGRYSKEVFAGK